MYVYRSQPHACPHYQRKEDYYVEDLNSMNGTWLNGKMLTYREKEQLCMNDVIQLGRERFTFL